ncbi:MAG: DUF2189 domain-containing protein [Betaproteobacteria bacterium]|nr:DUF2189 domain-containing protein [Betaproteobacteria bacterium]
MNNAMTPETSSPSLGLSLSSQRIALTAPLSAIEEGIASFRRTLLPSLILAGFFVLPGILLHLLVHRLGLAPMIWGLAGGFLLIAPVSLPGFFVLARQERNPQARPHLADAFAAFFRIPPAFLALAFFCVFMFLVWITDIGTVYSFVIGREYLPLAWESFIPLRPPHLAFYFWGSLMGTALAAILFVVSAFAIPLTIDCRATLVSAVSASARAIFHNFLPCFLWAFLLAAIIMTAAIFLPLLLFVLPVMAYATEILYEKLFPAQDGLPF